MPIDSHVPKSYRSSPSVTMSLMSLLLHAADISHPGKPWRMHKKFADTILDEFFLQGDEEAKLGKVPIKYANIYVDTTQREIYSSQ